MLPVGEPHTALEEHLLGVRPLDDETHEVCELLVRDLPSPFRLVLIVSDLSLHDIAQAQPTRHRHGGVLLLEHLGRPVMRLNDFQHCEGDHRRDPWVSVYGRRVTLAVAHRGGSVIASLEGMCRPHRCGPGEAVVAANLAVHYPTGNAPLYEPFSRRTDMRVTPHRARRIYRYDLTTIRCCTAC